MKYYSIVFLLSYFSPHREVRASSKYFWKLHPIAYFCPLVLSTFKIFMDLWIARSMEYINFNMVDLLIYFIALLSFYYVWYFYHSINSLKNFLVLFFTRNKIGWCSRNELYIKQSALSTWWDLCPGSNYFSGLLQRWSANVSDVISLYSL